MKLDKHQKDVLQSAVDTFGGKHQIGKLFEEMSELEEAIIKHHFGRDSADHIAEEIADVEIMLHQAKLIYGNKWLVHDYTKKKLVRLEGTVEEERRKNG